MPENQEQHYNIKKLHQLFTLATMILLASLLGMFAHDYAREWKTYQSKFRALEIATTKAKLEAEKKKLKDNPDYQKMLKDVEAARAKQAKGEKDIQQLENDLEKLKARHDLADQKYRFAKAEDDSLRYKSEYAASHHGADEKELKQKFDTAEKLVKAYHLDVESATKDINDRNKQIQDRTAEVRDIEKNMKAVSKQADLLEKKLKRIDPAVMTTANRIANKVRDLPGIDFANPNFKIQQVVLHDITDNVNFMQVPKVDRCVTCHMGIANPDFKDAPQPFTTHPNLELFVGNNSKHPLDEFGCTVCHGGRGRGTDFITTAHTPSSEKEAEEWKKKYNWHEYRGWETPMYPKQYVEAGCFKCHSTETTIKGAEKLNLGLNLIERAGCYSCHTIERYKNWPKPGPDLTSIGSKTSEDWAFWWIKDPKSFRPNTWMPSFFGQSNNSDPESLRRTDQEIHAIVYYLFKNSKDFPLNPIPIKGDVKKGEELIASVGCFACHKIEHTPSQEKTTRETLRREQGPNLIGLGTKTTKIWIYNWLKDPSRYHPETKMPNLRLSDDEAADAAEFLAADKNQDFLNRTVPPVDGAAISKITEDLLSKTESVAAAKDQVTKMSMDEKLQYSGKKLIRQYGCYSCHNIPGFENEKPIGTELTEEGSKPPEKLDFGFVKIEPTSRDWFTQKLKDPRIFDQGRVRAPDEKLRMPNFHFTDEETEAIVTAILGFVKEKPADSKMPARTAKKQFVEDGQKLVRQMNCQGCHIIEGEGGAIQAKVVDWLVKYNGKEENEAKAVVKSFSPPNLVGEGARVQAKWMFEFIHEPTPIRPWLKVRMPTYHLSAAQLNTIVKYFNYLDDEEFPFSEVVDTKVDAEEHEAARKLFSKDYFDCASCHIVGNQMPSGSPDRWAPNFALAKNRLKPNWVLKWLTNPQDLLPGTKMPTYFDPKAFDSSGPDDILGGDEHKQIKALRNFVLSLADEPPKKAEPAAAPAQPAAAVVPPAGTAAPNPETVTPPVPETKPADAPAAPTEPAVQKPQ